MAYAVPASASFVLNHKVVGAIPGFWSAEAYAQRLIKFTKEVNAFLRVTSDMTDAEALQTIEQVLDNLLIQDYLYDLNNTRVGIDPAIQEPSLFNGRNAPLRQMLSQVTPGTDADDVPAMTREMHRGSNNSGYTLD